MDQASLKVAQRSVRANIINIKNFNKPILGRGPFLQSQLNLLISGVMTRSAVYGVFYDDTARHGTTRYDTVYDNAVVRYTTQWHSVRHWYITWYAENCKHTKYYSTKFSLTWLLDIGFTI